MTDTPGRENRANVLSESSADHRTRYYPWVRLWTELPSDPKFRTISRLSKQPVTTVIAIFVVLLADAANAAIRGEPDIHGEDIASALDLEPEQVAAVLDAMQGRLLDGSRLSGWDHRQPIREDGSAERSREWRDRNRTPANATERNRTPQSRGEKSRGEKKSQHHLPAAPALVTFHEAGRFAGEAGSPALLPLSDGSEALLTEHHVAELTALFPAVDVPGQLRTMRAWLTANPKNRKTRSGVLRFVAAWLGKEQNRARASGTTPRPGKTADEKYTEQFVRRTGGKS